MWREVLLEAVYRVTSVFIFLEPQLITIKWISCSKMYIARNAEIALHCLTNSRDLNW